jgi:hypothetical protein
VLRFHDELLAAAPDDLATAVSFARDPQAGPVLALGVCWSGELTEGERVLAPLRSFARPTVDTIESMAYTAWQRGPDAGYPRGRRHYWKSGYLRELTDDAITTLVDLVPTMPSSASGIGMQSFRGTAARVPADATAFPHRTRQYDLLLLGQWDDAEADETNIAWGRRAHDALAPHLADAVYVNNLGSEGPDRVRAAYGTNHERLATLKRTWDPDNVFRLNQNIAPAPS